MPPKLFIAKLVENNILARGLLLPYPGQRDNKCESPCLVSQLANQRELL